MHQRVIDGQLQLSATGWRLSEAIGLADGTAPRATSRREHTAFDELIAEYQQPVARLVRRLLGWRDADVEDVVSDVFVSALEHWSSYRGEATAWTWLAAIAINRCRTHHRRRALKQRWMSWIANAPPVIAHDKPAAEQDETAAKVRHAVEALPAKDREVIVLYYLEELSVNQIVQILGVSPGAIDVRLHRARAKLRESLGELFET
jgi:RNA polymerase sigma-70 factor (ECF subfamily)